MERNLRSKKKILLEEECQLRYVKKYSTNDDSTIEVLNDDCLLHVFEYLPIADRIRFERVNKRWCTVSRRSWKSFKTMNFTSRLWGSQTVITRNGLKDVLYLCGEHLKVWDMSKITVMLAEPIYVESILQLCPNLVSVNFTSVKFGEAFIKSLIQNCKNIVILNLGTTSKSVGDWLKNGTILSTYKNLQVLYLRPLYEHGYSMSLRGDWVQFNDNNSIKELCLDYCHDLDQSNLFFVIPQLPNLHTLSLQGSMDRMKASRNLDFVKLSNIKVLDISNNPIRVNCHFLIENVDAFSRLTSLFVGNNTNVTDDGLYAVFLVSNLEHLNIDELNIKGSCLADLPQLKRLSCQGCNFLKEKYFRRLLGSSDGLESIDLRECSKIYRLYEFIELAKESVKLRRNSIKLRMYIDKINLNYLKIPENLKLFELESDEDLPNS